MLHAAGNGAGPGMNEPEPDDGISPIIAEMLMIALVCLAAIMAYVVIFQFPSLEKIPMVAVDITKSGSQVFLFHKNGDSLERGQFYVTVNGDRMVAGNVSLVGGAYPWSSGERLVVNYTGISAIRDVKLIYAGPSVSVVLASAYFSGSSGNNTPANTTPVFSRYPGFTAEGWVKWNVPPNPGSDTTSKWATIVVDGTTDNNRRYQLQHNSDNTKFEFALATATMGSSGTWVASTTTPGKGTWYYVTAVYNRTPGTMAIFVNGIPESGKTVDSTGLRASPGKYQVGGSAGIQWPGPTSMLRKFNGDMRGVKTYEEAFSQAEILAHYHAGVP
jgi:hypothetical protein